MPNIALLLKEEILRLARKEIRTELVDLRKGLSTQRAEIVELKKRLREVEKANRALTRRHEARSVSTPRNEEPTKLRFRAEGFAAKRSKLGLSAAEVGLLVGASPSAVYLWESGEARPRPKHMTAIAAFRRLGKREATKQLESLRAA